MTGSELFAQYIEAKCGTRLAAAYELGVSVSTVHYWLTSSSPRVSHRKKIAKWSRGAIGPDVPWREAKGQAA
jgi:DNA invertase Pin-like site-specific DNA recombinase